MRLFISTLSSSSDTLTPPTDITFGDDIFVSGIDDYHVSGTYYSGPSSLFFNGNYYGGGSTSYETKEKGFVWKYNPSNDDFTWAWCYGESTAEEEINHRKVAMRIADDGHIWIATNDPHVSPSLVYRSDNPEDITSFSLMSTLGIQDGEQSYTSIYLDGDDIVLSYRRNGTGNLNNCHSISRATIGTWNWVQTILYENTDANPRDVNYPTYPKQSVGNQWTYFLTGQRSGNSPDPVDFYAQMVIKTQDYQTFYSIDEVYSRDLVLDGPVPEAEVPNYMIRDNGWGNPVGVQHASIVNDVFVGYYYENGSHYIQWYDGSWHSVNVESIFDPLYGYDGGINNVNKIGEYYYFNVHSKDDANRVWKSAMPFTTFEIVFEAGLGNVENRNSATFPGNIDIEQKTIFLGNGSLVDGIIYNIVTFE